MSVENVKKFLDGAGREAIQTEFRGAQSQEEFENAMVRLGAQQGSSFTAADVRQAMASAAAPTGEELTEAQLGSVSGGGFFSEWYYHRFTSGLVKC